MPDIVTPRPVTWVGSSRKKKSKSGIATPKAEIDLIHRRLTEAERLHRERQR